MAAYKAAVAERLITPSAPNYPPPVNPARIPVFQEVRTSGGAAKVTEGVWPDFNGTPSELFTQAVVIEDSGGMRVAIVTFDSLGMTPDFTDDVKAAIVQRSGIPPPQVLLNASHSHNAPAVSFLAGGWCLLSSNEQLPLPEYVSAVKQRMVDVVADAVAALQPASLFFARGTTSIAGYRRKDGERPYGVPDPQDLDLLEIRDEAGVVMATVFCASCHPVTMYGLPWISSDFISDTRKHIEQNGGGKAVFIQGYGGDLMPWRQMAGEGPPESKDATGAALAADVEDTRANLVELSGPLSVALGSSPLALNSDASTWGATDHGSPVRWGNAGAVTLPLGIQILRIGDDSMSKSSWTLLALTHEVVSEWVPTIRGELPEIANLTLAAYSNAVQCYLPTNRMVTLDRTNCAVVPQGYEGCYSFGVYYKGLPTWTNEDVIEPIRTLVSETDPDLIDDFQTPKVDPLKWNVHVLSQFGETGCQQPFNPALQLFQFGNALHIRLQPSAEPSYSGYVSVDRFNFNGSQTSVRVVEVPRGAGAQFLLSVGPDGRHLCRFSIRGSAGDAKLVAMFSDAEGKTNEVEIGPYDPSKQRYVRLRHDAADQIMHWEGSADGTEWESLFQQVPAFDLSAVLVEIVAGTSELNATPGGAAIGDFRLIGTAQQPQRHRRRAARH